MTFLTGLGGMAAPFSLRVRHKLCVFKMRVESAIADELADSRAESLGAPDQ